MDHKETAPALTNLKENNANFLAYENCWLLMVYFENLDFTKSSA
jgi:hypothetical protein